MDGCGRFFRKHFPVLCVVGAVMAAFNCFVRPDYNLPLYMFIYLMWDSFQQSRFDKLLMLGLLALTALVDFIWLIYWGPFWRSDVMKNWEYGIHTCVIILSIVALIYKVIVMIMLILAEGVNLLTGTKPINTGPMSDR